MRIVSLLATVVFTATLGHMATAEEQEPIVDDGKVVSIHLTGNDMLAFNLKEIRVKSGRTVRLTLEHVGVGTADVMGHNFVLLVPGTDVTDFALKAVVAESSGFIPEDEKGKVIVHTDVVGGGESTTIEFPAPDKGTYDFLCSFIGHFATMQGKFIVE